MRFLTLLFTVAAVLPGILAGPAALPAGVQIEVYPGEKTGKHIVTLKDGASKDAIVARVGELLAGKPGTGITDHYDTIFSGFAGNFDNATLSALQVLPGVASISEDGIAHATVTQTNAPWGLARLSSRNRLASNADNALAHSYNFDPRAGSGVDIYVIDTGVRTTHREFQGRARFGAAFATSTADGNGHGTHCAGTAIGGTFGVAKAANVIAVKVLENNGRGSIANIILGMQYVMASASQTRRPSVASMSLGAGANSALDMAARNLVQSGVHVVVAAGNDNIDASNVSPAREPSVITVAASTISDSKADFSNYGPAIDVFAPGLNVISAWYTSDTDAVMISGTSMATPHVAGLIAYLISIRGNMSPAAMTQQILALSLRGVLSGLPADTANVLVNNGF
ncbi:serine protease [Coprinellus micaceus]|uniref:Serine protease n=1 Tax=Coprinellus micaceus TaxID=71717 RepID=A0A4Y7S9A8_COPMI|nr:serine protease [Coprinellus micaceus]